MAAHTVPPHFMSAPTAAGGARVPSSPPELRRRYPHVACGALEKKGDVFGLFHTVEAEGYFVAGEEGGAFLALFVENTKLVRRVLKLCKPCQERKDKREFLLYDGTDGTVQVMVFRATTPEACRNWIEGMNNLWERHEDAAAGAAAEEAAAAAAAAAAATAGATAAAPEVTSSGAGVKRGRETESAQTTKRQAVGAGALPAAVVAAAPTASSAAATAATASARCAIALHAPVAADTASPALKRGESELSQQPTEIFVSYKWGPAQAKVKRLVDDLKSKGA